MKRAILGLVALVCLCGTAMAAERITVTKDSAGTMGNVSAYVTASGQTVWQIMSDGSVSMYATTFNSQSYVTAIGRRGEPMVYNSTNSGTSSVYQLSGASIQTNSMPPGVLNAAVTTGVSSIGQTITGNVFYLDLSSSETLSGNSLYGSRIGNWGSTNEVTATFPSALKGMSTLVMNNQGQANGQTIFMVFSGTDTLVGVTGAWSSSTSAMYVSGTTLQSYVSLEAWQDGYWFVTGSSGVKFRNR